MVLHTLACLPGNRSFTDCLRCAAEGDCIVLLGDGVYAALPGCEALTAISGCPAKVLVLQQDLQAAGITAPALHTVDMDGLVALTEYYPRQLAWY